MIFVNKDKEDLYKTGILFYFNDRLTEFYKSRIHN